MKKLVCLCSLVLFCAACCVENDEVKETAPTTAHTATSVPASTSTTLSPTTTSIIPTTTSSSTSTTIPETTTHECEEKNKGTERDACYLSHALSTGNASLCDLIETKSARELCLDGTAIETDGTSTTLQGYVTTSETPVKGVKVSAISKTYGETIAKDTTDNKGFYSMDVPSRDTYEVTVILEGNTYTEEVYAQKGRTHEIWFRIPRY
ncbi:MAG: carboxypeptidase regulatory-like domain-containing protein [Candidatus Altiarchaeota archaeon]|nr:carboxypeptidase regulatory-like domain-containing protein [Candidatus Altiarchaeota archaeon]